MSSNKSLYRRSGLPVIIALLVVAFASPGFAQMPQLKRPHDEDAEKAPVAPKPVKKVKGPRAIALLQTTSKGKTTLIPIAIQVEGKFYDASEYKADPVPMALESGTIYEVERSGSSQGLFTVNRALHYKSPNSLHPWVGDGSFLANGTEAASKAHKAEDVPRGMNSSSNDGGPPRLSRPATPPDVSSASTANPAGSDKSASSPASSDKPSTGSSGSSSATTPAPPSDSTTKAPASGSPSAGSNQDSKSASAPSSSPTQTQQAQAVPAKPADQPQENYYRPMLRRGKPTSQAPAEEAEDEPAPSKPDSKSGSKDNAASADASPPQLVPAISDGGGPDPRSYKFFWKNGEEEDRRNQMQELAANEVRAYIAALEKNRIAAQPAAARKPAPRKPPAKPVQPIFENMHFEGFDVWLNNQPVTVFTAEAHMPATAGSTAAPETYNVTLVARTDIYGDLRKLYSGVTDRFHLDVTPKLELIDVVDADGDGRGELLFNETTDAGTGYVIYRATPDKLWKLFDTLGGGA